MYQKKWFFVIVVIAHLSNLHAQKGAQIGASVSTSFHLNSHRANTGIWSSESGYGFALGVPVKFWNTDTRALNTGIEYEFIAFDNWFNNTFVSSMRFTSVHIPLTYQLHLISSWYANVGTGTNLFLRSRTVAAGNNVNISNSVNFFQPYLSLGISTLAERGVGFFELGVLARYHFLDIWKKDYPLVAVTSSKIISMDLQMRFYF